MTSARTQLGIIFLTIFIDLIGFGIVIPVLPLYAEHFGATTVQIGLLTGIFSLMQFLGSPIWGTISDRIGRKPILIVSVLGTAAGFFMMGFAGSLVVLILARALAGISGGNISTAQAYIADITKPENRSRAMGLIGAAFGLGFIIGPAVGGWMSSKFGYAAPMFLAAWMAVANVLLVALILPESLPAEERSRRASLPRKPLVPGLFQHMQTGTYLAACATYFFTIAGFSVMTTMFPLFLKHRFDLDAMHTGYIFALVGFVGAFIQGGMIGRLSKTFGDARLAMAGTVFLGIAFTLLPLCSHVVWVVLVSCLVAIGNSLCMPTLAAISSKAVEAEWQGRALGVFQSVGSLARFSGPLFGGWMMTFNLKTGHDTYGHAALWASAALLAVGFLLSLQIKSRTA